MVTDAPTAPSPARTIPLPAPLRRLRCQVARWALEQGRPLHLDAITIVLAVRHAEFEDSAADPFRWECDDVTSFLWGTAGEWCTHHEVELPDSTAETLWTYLAFLAATSRLGRGSAPIGLLRTALLEHSGLNRAGRSRHPSGRNLAQVRALRPSG